MQRTIPNTAPAQKVGNVRPGTRIHIQVLNGAGAVACRFASRQDLLDNPTPFGGAQGFLLTSANGVVELIWQEAEIWAEGLAANASQPVIEISGGNF